MRERRGRERRGRERGEEEREASFECHSSLQSSEFRLPPREKMDHIGGECNRSLDLRWSNDNGTKLGVAMNFTTDKVLT